jgi:thioesterase domain-containing protein
MLLIQKGQSICCALCESLRKKSDKKTQELAAIYADEIRQILPDGPIQIIGFCEGAKLAHFMAERLHDGGRQTAMFVSIDYAWPRTWDGPVLHVQSENYVFLANRSWASIVSQLVEPTIFD